MARLGGLIMLSVGKMILDGIILSFLASLSIVVSLRLNPRIWLQDFPKDIQNEVPPKSQNEKRLSLVFGIPLLIVLFAVPFVSTLTLKHQSDGIISFFLLFMNASGVAFIFNLVDWLLLDWLMFCTITPRFVVIPGTEGMAGYKNYCFHFRGFVVRTVLSVVAGLVIAVIVSFL